MKDLLNYQQLVRQFPNHDIICFQSKENEDVLMKSGNTILCIKDLYWVDQEENIWLKEYEKDHMISHFACKFHLMDKGLPENIEDISLATALPYFDQAEEFRETREWKKAIIIFPDLAE